MRKMWISNTGKLFVWPDSASVRKATVFAKKYPRCHVEQELTNGASGQIVKGVTHLIYFSQVMSKALAQCDSLIDLYFVQKKKFDGSKLVLPANLKSLRFCSQTFDVMPCLSQSLTTLIIGDNAYDIAEQFQEIKLPQSLIDLHVEFYLPATVGFLPKSLKRLMLGGFDDLEQVTADYWPTTLTHLAFIDSFPQEAIPLPSNLQFLHLERMDMLNAENVKQIAWPKDLHSLTFGCWAQWVIGILEANFPASVTFIRFAKYIAPWNEDPFSIFSNDPGQYDVPEVYQDLVTANVRRIKQERSSSGASMKKQRI